MEASKQIIWPLIVHFDLAKYDTWLREREEESKQFSTNFDRIFVGDKYFEVKTCCPIQFQAVFSLHYE